MFSFSSAKGVCAGAESCSGDGTDCRENRGTPMSCPTLTASCWTLTRHTTLGVHTISAQEQGQQWKSHMNREIVEKVVCSSDHLWKNTYCTGVQCHLNTCVSWRTWSNIWPFVQGESHNCLHLNRVFKILKTKNSKTFCSFPICSVLEMYVLFKYMYMCSSYHPDTDSAKHNRLCGNCFPVSPSRELKCHMAKK